MVVNLERYYPALDIQWVNKVALVSDLEVSIAQNLGFLNAKVDSANSKYENKISVDKNVYKKFLDKYFCLSILNVYEEWFSLDKPFTALEFLILDFQESDLIAIGDRMLPAEVAGMAGLDEQAYSSYDFPYYEKKVSVHNWLGKYILEILKQKKNVEAIL